MFIEVVNQNQNNLLASFYASMFWNIFNNVDYGFVQSKRKPNDWLNLSKKFRHEIIIMTFIWKRTDKK